MAAQRVALYCRVSTEDPAERSTIDAQRDFLRNYVNLYGLAVADEYADDGCSGTVPLGERPEGRRLPEAAQNGAFGVVLVYRIDRLGRSLSTLLEANDVLSQHGVTIRSASEPFDTGSNIGRFLFQLLASLAELDRGTMLERMSMGRDRVAREGQWTGGPVPFGYDVDTEGRLMLSQRMVAQLDQTEADVARSVFEQVAGGSTTVARCRRLNALGVPTHRRYSSGALVTVGENWLPSRINAMLKNEVYKGRHTLKSRFGAVERAVPVLVSPETWQAVQSQLVRNRCLSTHGAG